MSYRLVRTEDLPVVREIMYEYQKESETYRNHRVDIEGFLNLLSANIAVDEALMAVMYTEPDGRVTQVAVMSTSFYFADPSKLLLTVLGVYTRDKCTGNFYKYLDKFVKDECYDYVMTGFRLDEDRVKAHDRLLVGKGYKPLTLSYMKEVTWQQQS